MGRPTGKLVATLPHKDRVTHVRFVSGRPRVDHPDHGVGRMWDVVTGDVVATLSGHTGLVRAVRVSADGSRIVTASDDRTARVWEVPTGREIASLVGHALRVRVSIMGRSRGRHLPMMLTRAGVWTYDGASWQNVCYDLIDDALEISVAVDANGRYVVVGQKLTGVQTGTTIVRRVTP